MLQAHTSPHAVLPEFSGYQYAAVLGLCTCAATIGISFFLPRARRGTQVDAELVRESVDAAASGTFLYDEEAHTQRGVAI